MSAFGDYMRALMAERGISLHRLAKTVTYDVGYLSKVRNGKKTPSPQLAGRLDEALRANGTLAALAPPPARPAARPAEPPPPRESLAEAVRSIRDDLHEDAKLLHARACQLALAADPLRAALCRGQAIACDNAAEHLNAALIQSQPGRAATEPPGTVPGGPVARGTEGREEGATTPGPGPHA